MKPTTKEEILEVLDGCAASATLGAGMELGIFWLLDNQVLRAEDIAERLGIPFNRCRYFLDLLLRMGLIEEAAGGFSASPAARHAILETYRQDTWALLAQETRESLPALQDLALHLREHGSIFDVLEFSLPDYVSKMNEDPGRARRFTNMLYEIHQDLAKALPDLIDIGSSRRMLDLGGGSGVVSFSFLRKHPELTSVVVDIASVCAAGEEIAREVGMEDRVTYLALNFIEEDLPVGFDFILECDINVYSEELFRKIRHSLNPGGRFVIVDQLPLKEGAAPDSRLEWAFFGSLKDPNFAYPTAGQVVSMLERAGFQEVKLRDPSAFVEIEFMNDIVIIEAFKGEGQAT